MSKLFSCDYLTAHRYDEMKCHKNINFEEVDTEPATGKNDGFLLLWGIFKDYIKQSIIMTVLRSVIQMTFADW